MKLHNDSLLAIRADWLEDALGKITGGSLPLPDASWWDDDTSSPPAYETRGNVAILRVEGVMERRPSLWSWYFGGCSTETLIDALTAIENDPAVSACVVLFATPGGTVDGITDFATAITRLDATKPVVGYADGLCCSAGMWAASQCRELAGSSVSIVGSIGVLQVVRDSSEAAAKAGYKIHAIGTSPHKGAATPGTPITSDHKAEFQRIVDSIFSQFKAAVKTGRNLSDAQLAAVADARVWVGPDAVKNHLLDRIATLDETIARAASLATQNTPSGSPNTASHQAAHAGHSGSGTGAKRMGWKEAVAGFKAGYRAAGGTDVEEDDEATLAAALAVGSAQQARTQTVVTNPAPAAAAPAVNTEANTQIVEQGKQIEKLTALVGTLAGTLTAQQQATRLTANNTAINDLVRQMRLTPAQAEDYRKLATDNPDAFEAVLPTLKQSPVQRQLARQATVKAVPTTGGNAGEQLVALTKKRMAETKEDYATAWTAVITENTDLAAEHQQSRPVVGGSN